jgi:hypothetical protein
MSEAKYRALEERLAALEQKVWERELEAEHTAMRFSHHRERLIRLEKQARRSDPPHRLTQSE